MVQRFRNAWQSYPGQFWLLITGLLISTIGTSMIWPFLTIYASETLGRPLTAVGGLISINGLVSLSASFIAGPITDRAGRKWIMALSLIGNGLTYLALSQATTYQAFAFLMGLRGLFQPLYRVGLNAMISDLIPPEGRSEAFALVRMFNNVGVGIGPAIGGFVVVSSYVSSFYAATLTLTLFGAIIAIFARETMPDTGPGRSPSWMSSITGYGSVFKNRRFLYFLFSFSLLKICSVMLWTLMAVYSKENYHLPENQYGLLQTTNATMVVLFQVGLTRITNRYAPLRVLAIGSTIYAFGVGSIALGQGFWGFWLSYLVVTIGELMVMPTASTMVANLAPPDKRGRYMSAFSLAQGGSRSVAPVMGGLLNDNVGPKSIWYGGGTIGLIGAACFALMARRTKRSPTALPAASTWRQQGNK